LLSLKNPKMEIMEKNLKKVIKFIEKYGIIREGKMKKRKKRYTIKQLKRFYREELDIIFREKLEDYEYKTILSCPIKTMDWFNCSSEFVPLCHYFDIFDTLGRREIGKIFGMTIEINKQKEMIIKLKQLQKK